MTTPAQLLTNHLDIWAAAVAPKSTAGRGNNGNLELYGLKKLRALILELAVRGLLVPQDPDDEPAAALLKKIVAEKARLVKEGKIKKQEKLLPVSEDEKPFKLPNGWEWCSFGDIYSLEYGKSLPDLKRSGTGEYAVYGSNGVVGSHNEGCVKKPCIVVGRKGSAGAVNLCLDSECWVTDVAYSVIPPSNLNIEFVFRQFYTLGLDKLGKGIKPGLNRNEAYMLKIAIPPLQEQHRIVAKVDELMALCDQLEQRQNVGLSAHQTLVGALLAALVNAGGPGAFADAWAMLADHFDSLFTTEDSIDQLKHTLVQLAVMGKLVPQNPADEPAAALLQKIAAEKARLVKAGKLKKPGKLPPIREDEKPFDLPEGWEWLKVGDVSLLQGGFAYQSTEFIEESDFQVIRMGNIRPDKFRFNENAVFITPESANNTKEYEILNGDIILTMTGTKGKRDYLYSLAVKGADIERKKLYLNQRLCIVRPISMNVFYLNLAMKDERLLDLIYAKSTGTANQANIGMGAISNWIIPIPGLCEQNRIVAKVDELMALCDRLREHLAAARATQQQLADAVTAQVVG